MSESSMVKSEMNLSLARIDAPAGGDHISPKLEPLHMDDRALKIKISHAIALSAQLIG